MKEQIHIAIARKKMERPIILQYMANVIHALKMISEIPPMISEFDWKPEETPQTNNKYIKPVENKSYFA